MPVVLVRIVEAILETIVLAVSLVIACLTPNKAEGRAAH